MFLKRIRNFIHNQKLERSSTYLISFLRGKGIEIGDNCKIRHPRSCRIDISRPALIRIGNNVDMNKNFQILTHDWSSRVFRHEYHDFVNSSGFVNIGNNIYFGTDVIVLKGVTIGDNCIIGAGSIITKDIPPQSVAIGAPCRVVCSLQEYYRKRKDKGLQEAVEYVKAIRARFNRDPYPSEMREEFIYFVNKMNAKKYEDMGVPIKFQLAEAYDDWLERDEAPFKDFDEFLKYCDEH